VVQHRARRDGELGDAPAVGEIAEVEHHVRVQAAIIAATTRHIVVGEVAVDRLRRQRRAHEVELPLRRFGRREHALPQLLVGDRVTEPRGLLVRDAHDPHVVAGEARVG
jgi:hypothetical protein